MKRDVTNPRKISGRKSGRRPKLMPMLRPVGLSTLAARHERPNSTVSSGRPHSRCRTRERDRTRSIRCGCPLARVELERVVALAARDMDLLTGHWPVPDRRTKAIACLSSWPRQQANIAPSAFNTTPTPIAIGLSAFRPRPLAPALVSIASISQSGTNAKHNSLCMFATANRLQSDVTHTHWGSRRSHLSSAGSLESEFRARS